MQHLHSRVVFFLLCLVLVIGRVSSAPSRKDNIAARSTNVASHVEAMMTEIQNDQIATKKVSMRGRKLGFENFVWFEKLEAKNPFRKTQSKVSLHKKVMQTRMSFISGHGKNKIVGDGTAAFDPEDYPGPMHHLPRHN